MGDPAASNMINWLRLNRRELLITRAAVVEQVRLIFESARLVPDEAARNEFIDLAVSVLTDADARFTRVAECATDQIKQQTEPTAPA